MLTDKLVNYSSVVVQGKEIFFLHAAAGRGLVGEHFY